MKTKFTCLITAESAASADLYYKAFPESMFNITFQPCHGEIVLRNLVVHKPEVALLNSSLLGMDIMDVKKSFCSISEKQDTLFYAMGETQDVLKEKELLNAGFEAYLHKPIDISFWARQILQKILETTQAQPKQRLFTNPESDLADMLRHLGIPPHIKGHYFIIEAVRLMGQNSKYDRVITKVLYPEIARTFGATPSQVERGIRYAISLACQRCSEEKLAKIFGSTLCQSHPRPTNSEFLFVMLDFFKQPSLASGL